ncbi:MAG TPA: hypothetical protein VF169_07260 [Albitalea sp.]|uniref:hypothetical protein n=1 Tax=Piscinibacter sp. TaxID=1903157 RepID=UPI002ED5B15B
MPSARREHFEPMTGSFIRVRFRSADFQSPTIRDGTHQGVLLDGPHRQLFKRIEAAFQAHPPEPIWGGVNYAAPLCTSCNMSGDPEGSIVRTEKALAFARLRGLRLVLTCPPAAGELGSYPVLGYEPAGVRVHRPGPCLERFKEKVPPALRTW